MGSVGTYTLPLGPLRVLFHSYHRHRHYFINKERTRTATTVNRERFVLQFRQIKEGKQALGAVPCAAMARIQ